MRNRGLVLIVTCALVALGCPGSSPPKQPTASVAPTEPLKWRESKSGLGFRLSNADEDADGDPTRSAAPFTPLGADEAKKIVARLPALATAVDDAKDFSIPVTSVPAPRPGRTVQEAFPPSVSSSSQPLAAGPLTVERHSPEGPVDVAPHLTMSFSQPMVPITSIEELTKEKRPVTLVPEPSGTWRWLGTKTLMFQPSQRFPMATEYAVEIPAGTKAQNGQTLAKATKWTFSTPPITLKTGWPTSPEVSREPLLFAEFDQQVDRDAILGSIELGSATDIVALRHAEPEAIEADENVRRLSQRAEKGRWLALRPTAKLKPATSYTVCIKPGAPSAEGPRRTTKIQEYSFQTFGPLRVHHSTCFFGSKCPPLTPFRIEFTNSIDRRSFDKKFVRVTPELPGMKIEVQGQSLVIHGRTKGRTTYEVTVSGDIADAHEQKMGVDATVKFAVDSAEPRLFGAARDMVVLDPAAAKVYNVYSINEPGLRARVLSVTPADWEKYVQYSQEWERPRRLRPPGRIVSERVLTPRQAPDELVSTPIDLRPALQDGYGQVLVMVESTRAPSKDRQRSELAVWVQSTSIGLSAYLERDRVTGWATRLADGAPESGVEFSLLGGARATTDKDGLASIANADFDPFVIARKGKDTVIIPAASLGGGAYRLPAQNDQARWFVFDDRGMYKPGEEVHIKGWLRRAGSSLGGDLNPIADLPGNKISWKVRDSRAAEIGEGFATADASGGFDYTFKLPANASLGHAYVEMSIAGSNLDSTTFGHGFQVQEFRRPEFEVLAKSTEGPHFVGKHAVASVTASYYSGGGLADAPVKWNVTRSTVSFTPPNLGDYHFGPEPLYHWSFVPADRDVKTETWTSHTNGHGTHRLRVDFDALSPPYPMSLAMTAVVEDKNRQEWAGRTTMLVHPAERTVGIRAAKNFIRAGEKIDVDLVASDVDGHLTPGRPITVKASRLESEQQGSEYVEKEVDTQTCDVRSGAAGEKVRCSFHAPHEGRWRVTAVVTDEQGRKSQTATQVYVMGTGPSDRRLGEDRVTLAADKQEYQPGDVAELLVLSPEVPAEGLLTVRRQGIVHLERFTMKSASHVLKVKLEDGLVPNVELRVDLAFAASFDDASDKSNTKLPRRPGFASDSVSLKILPTTRTLSVAATARKPSVEPGGATHIDVDVKEPDGKAAAFANVAVIVADEAVLALSGYKTPDPLAVFYAPRPSGVEEREMRERVLLSEPEFLGRASASMRAETYMYGGAAAHAAPMPSAALPMAPQPAVPRMDKEALEAPRDAQANAGAPSSAAVATIQLRSNFAPLALFAPRVKTDARGHASVPLKLPDNLTRYRIMAIAAAGDRSFGSNESTITARLPVMVRPSAPRFLNFGDTFEFPVIVQNQTDVAIDVGVVARASNATVEEPASKRVKIAPNDRVEIRFAAATIKPGIARFQIGVSSGAFSDASEVELPVYTPATTEAFATYGEIDAGAIAQPVKMPSNVFPHFGGVEISTSSTQLQALTDAILYLVKYPFECNEQIASRVMSIAALRDVLAAFNVEGVKTPKAIEASMKGDFEKLRRHQNANGGWGFWQETPWPYLSVHVAHALIRAKEKGYQPDESMLRRAQQYLQKIEAHIPRWYGEDAKRSIVAYSLFVRKRMNDSDPSRAKLLIREAGGVEKLPLEALGWIWPTVSEDNAATVENEQIRRYLANRVTETAGNAHFVTGYKDADWVLLHSDRRADGILLEAMIGDQKGNALIPKLVKGLLAHRKNGRWTNTNESAFVLLALDRYFRTFEGVTPDFVASVWLGDRFASKHAFKGRTTETSETRIPMQWLAGEFKDARQNLVIGKEGPGRLYYRIGMQYAPTDLKLPPADHGFVVSRVYEGAESAGDVKRDGDGTWRVKLGSKVRVRVSMVAQSRRYHVALVDPIPAGLEALNSALAVTGEIPKDPQAELASFEASPYRYWSRTWYEHQNMRDERVEAFASLLREGVWDYTYVAKATTPGRFVVPPLKAEEMYAPETFGRSAGDRMIIE